MSAALLGALPGVSPGALAEPLARTSEGSKSGPIGLAIILIMCIACYFLFKSMSKHLKHVREDFPGQRGAGAPVASAAPAALAAPPSGAATAGTAPSGAATGTEQPAQPAAEQSAARNADADPPAGG